MPRLNIIFEDNHLLVIEKPARMPVQPDPSGSKSLLDSAKEWLQERYQKKGNVYLGLVHRLDRPVGGIVAFAKTSKAAGRLSEQFREGKADKRYLALVGGEVPNDEGTLEGYMATAPQNKMRVLAKEQPGTKYAKLSFKKLQRAHAQYPEATFLEVKLHTGRKHQIRAQLAAVGHPVVGDRKYGSRIPLAEGKIALVAHRLTLAHPISGDPMTFELDIDSNWPHC